MKEDREELVRRSCASSRKRHPKKSGGVLRDAEMRVTFIAAKKAEHTVTILCRCLCVTRSGFLAGPPRIPHARNDRRSARAHLVCGKPAELRQSAVHDDLIDWQEHVSRKRVVRLMQEEGLKARVRKRYKPTTMSDHDQPGAAICSTGGSRRRRRINAGSGTRPSSSSGKLYLAVILDLFSRFVVGWALSAVNDRHLTIKALEMALKRRCPDFGLRITPTRAARTRAGTTRPPRRARHRLQHEPPGQLLRQRRDGKLPPVKNELASHGDAGVVDYTKCSITNGAGIRQSAASVRRPSNGEHRWLK